jgi:hypothetical protein
MARSIQKKITRALIVAADQALDSFDVTNYSGVCISAFFVGATGSMKLQRSNDGVNWVDIPSATMTFAGNHALVDVTGIHAGFVRPVFTISGGPGDYLITYLAKDI